MNIFYKRPLALILCITVGGFAFASYNNLFTKILLITLSILLFVLSFIKKIGISKAIFRFSALAIILSAVFSFLYFDIYFAPKERFGKNVSIVATVEETEPINSYTTRITLKCKEINGKRQRYTFITYLSIEDTQNLASGNIITARANIIGFDDKSTERQNFAKGINGKLDDVSDIEIIDTEAIHLPTHLGNIREHLSRYVAMLTDSETGAFLTALLIGDRDKLSPEVRLNFKRIGISHILALSGMHLAILSLGIGKLLSACQIRKKSRLIITSLFIILYMALTGFSSSVLRAGIMLIIYSALFLLSKSKDSFTSLCCSVFIILTVSPYSVFDISLWLSALATLGIIALSEYLAERKKVEGLPKRILNWLTAGVLSSVFAISATLLISVSVFGAISLLSVIATLIFSVLTELIMYLGCIAFMIGWLIPIGKIIVPLCRFTLWLAERFSSLDFVYFRIENALSLVLIYILTFAFFGFVILKIKKTFIHFIVFLFVICHTVPLIGNSIFYTPATLTYYSSEASDDFLLSSEKETCLISSAKYSKYRAYSAVSLLSNKNINVLDNYYVTHYSRQIEDELEILLGNVKTERIYLLKPQNEEEESILKKLQRFLGNYSTELIILDKYQSFEVGKYRVTPLYSAPYGEESSMNAFSISSYTETVCYISSGLLESREKDTFYNFIKCADKIILGSHGKKYKKRVYLAEQYENLSSLIIGSSNVFVTQENMEEYKKNGCEVISHPSKVELLE